MRTVIDSRKGCMQEVIDRVARLEKSPVKGEALFRAITEKCPLYM